MNKINKILAIGFALVSILFISSCVEDDDFVTPELTVTPVNVAALGKFTSFSNIVARYTTAVANNEQVGVFSVENESPLYTIGYVVSDDTAGNFFEEIVIQNSIDGNDPSNDVRRGLKVEINARDLGGFYNFGRKVYIKLNGLAIGEENGVFTLGKSKGNSLVQLEDAEFKDYILRDPETAVITPKSLSVIDLTNMDENTFIKLGNSQILKRQKNFTYAGEPFDNYDGFRTIESCDVNVTVKLQTSTFADFKGAQLPIGKGSISGVFTRDFGDDNNVIVLNAVTDINFTDMNRCDPPVLECTGVTSTVSTVYSENFTGFTGYNSEGWTMTNEQGGNVDWFVSTYQGNTYSRISAYNSNETSKVWLVTPDVDLSASTGEELNFDVESAYYNQDILRVFVSEDFTGDVATATWVQLDANIPSAPASGNFSGLQPAGPINVSCLNGSVNFAFVYSGSDSSGATTRYHVDNIKVTGN